jgi:uncharacterized membrane protein YcaP (DUF421 family)
MSIDWGALFVPSVPVAETIIRGSVVYLVLVALMRIRRREAGAIGITDLLVVVVIADAAQNAMSGDYKSITDGLILIGTIGVWDYGLDWLAYRVPAVRGLLRARALPLIVDGRIQRRHLKSEMITEEELMSQLREQGVEKVDQVKRCCLEGDGHISVIRKTEDGETKPRREVRS